MNRDKLFTFLWSCLLAFFMSLGATGCLVSGFKMAVDIGTLVLWCAVGAVVCSLCYSLPLGILPASSMALIGGVLWQKGLLDTSVESLLYRLSRQYDRGHGWGILKLNYLTADDMELRLWLIVCILGVLIAMLISWSVCRKKTAVPGMLLSMLLLGACMVVTDTVPATVYLFLLLFAAIVLMMTGMVRRQNEARGNRLSAILSAPVFLLLLILFAAMPRDGYTGNELPRKLMDSFLESEFTTEILGITPEAGTTGSSVDSSVVNLQNVGVRVQSQAEVMQVLTDFDGKLYLRGRALDRYDGITWTDSGVSTSQLFWPSSSALADGGEVMITTRYAHRMLYLPYYVSSRDLTDVTKGLENTKKLTQYSFSCDVLSVTNDHYKIYTQVAYEEAWDVEFSRYLHLSDDVWAWAEPLALEIVAGKETVYDRAQAIGNYVRSSATYSTNTYRMPSGSKDFVRWFLENSDTGYCVHFASAATVLLQASGIPARYVTGYTVDAVAASPAVIRAKDAHAWVEYWLPGYGWMVLEVTPAAQEQDPTVDQLPQTQPTEEPKKPATDPGSDLGALILLPVAAVLVALAVALIRRSVRLAEKRKRLRRGTPNERALCAWQEMTQLARALDEEPDQRLYTLAEKAKFSQHTLTGEELALFDAALSAARSRLKKRSLFRQLYYRLILVLY